MDGGGEGRKGALNGVYNKRIETRVRGGGGGGGGGGKRNKETRSGKEREREKIQKKICLKEE